MSETSQGSFDKAISLLNEASSNLISAAEVSYGFKPSYRVKLLQKASEIIQIIEYLK